MLGVHVTWGYPANPPTPITDFAIFRREANVGPTVEIGAIPYGSPMEFLDTDVTYGKTYVYSVRARNQEGLSNGAAEATAVVRVPLPVAPTGAASTISAS